MSKTSQWGLSKTSDINFTIASFAANGRSQCGVVTPERVAKSKTSQWGLSKTRDINFTIASFAAMVVQSTGCDEQNESNFGKRILKRKSNNIEVDPADPVILSKAKYLCSA